MISAKILLFLLVFRLVQIHEHGDKRGLSIGGHQRNHLILDRLNAAVDLFLQAGLPRFCDHASSHGSAPAFHLPSMHFLADLFSADICTNGARCAREMHCPPYWLLATCAMICVAILHAVEKAVRLLNHCAR